MSETDDSVLVVVEGPDLGRKFYLAQHRLTLGRGIQDDLRVEDPCVTRKQLTIEWDGTANAHCVHQAGDSLTVFNNIPASRNAGVWHQLCEGDQLQIGGTVLRYTRNALDSQQPQTGTLIR